MKQFLLAFLIGIVVLFSIIYLVEFIFGFHLANVAFTTGIIAMFITYGGSGDSNIGEASAAKDSMGNYSPGKEKRVSRFNPFFLASVLTFVSSFVLFPFID